MRTVYKVWIEIEELDDETGDSTTLDAPGAALQTFETYEEAYALAEVITDQFADSME